MNSSFCPTFCLQVAISRAIASFWRYRWKRQFGTKTFRYPLKRQFGTKTFRHRWKKVSNRHRIKIQRCRNVLVPNCLFNGYRNVLVPNCLFQRVPKCLGAELSFSTGAELDDPALKQSVKNGVYLWIYVVNDTYDKTTHCDDLSK
jgi:hypothetical protein